MKTSRRIYFCDRATDFLQHLLTNVADTTVLVICSTRETFLEQLYDDVSSHAQDTATKHALLTKSLGMLSRSSRIQLAFCPTLEHFRAFISVLSSPTRLGETSTSDSHNSKRPLMAVLNPIALHVSSSEFSAQGLSRTLATAVEVCSKEAMDLVLCECGGAPEFVDIECGEALWYVEVPFLNGATRRAEGEGIWSGRSVPVRRIVQRWFDFDDSNRTIAEPLDI
ncbi:uncharacterized protein P174DRAFT_428858 [Aspergillus novofumigatus IBT 16806]|uniref:Uncharacterized protein n=1 Tax=Aspergillus novofumigatus (strain IBT 16806) TaxID=1392255 RepID=A0A2I1CIG0_ASPN1|nr:uncharacterized protein P174DRAFT_428858 [Aspergillus novofumigatus IBT 16806]PKX97418.1 hypothetical protein P174DRAFT_428858 [Aspergillus novofumigatus IBT 16806]